MRKLLSLLALTLALPIASAQTAAGKVSVTWLGQSAFKITTPRGLVIVTDPWLTPKVPLRAPGDLNAALMAIGVLPPELLPRMNKGGTITPAPGIKVTAVHAEHSSVYVWRNPATSKDEVHNGGEPRPGEDLGC